MNPRIDVPDPSAPAMRPAVASAGAANAIPPSSESHRGTFADWLRHRRSESALAIVLLIVALIGATQSDGVFLTWENWKTILLQGSFLGILASGMTLLMVGGLIDLSVGAAVSFTGMVFGATLMNSGVPLGLALVLAVAAALGVGVVNGVLTANSVAHPFILTLGTMTLLQGLSQIIDTRPIIGFPNGYIDLVASQPLGLPFAFLVFAAVGVVCHILLSRTVLGRHIYALGGSRDAARLAGVRVRPLIICLYIGVGGLVAVTSLLMVGTFSSAGPQAGAGMELIAIAAVAVGGTPLEGGRGGIPGTMMGLLLIVMIGNVLNLMAIDSNLQYVLVGIIIVVAVMAQGRSRMT